MTVTVNRHNCRIWSSIPPGGHLERESAFLEVNAWCSVTSREGVGTFFFAKCR